MTKKIISLLISLAFSLNVLADSPAPPSVGGTGISNNNAYTIALGGAISTQGAVTFSGIFPFTANLLASTNITFPSSGTLLTDSGSYADPSWLTSLDGSKLTGTVTATALAPGTYGINISGNAATVTTNANLSGDVNSVGNVATLPTVNSTPGSFGNGTHVGSFTVNAKGQITAANDVTITGAAPTGSAGGDLSSLYPNPTVSAVNGVALGLTTATSGNILIGSGTQWVTRALSGDGTLSSLGAFTVTKTNGVSFAASATTDTTNAGNVSSGTLPSGRLSGTYGINISGNAATVTNGVYTTDIGTVTNAMLAGSIADSKLNTISTAGKVLNSATTATDANTASAIVARDASGNFIANIITAALSGNASTATTLQTARNINGVSFNGSADITITAAPSGSAGGDLTGSTYPNPVIANSAVTNAKIANSTIDLTTKVTGTLPGGNGGTNNAFMQFSGPATSTKTYTLPNASATILTTNAAVTAAQGGTGLNSSAWALGDLPYISATGVWNHQAGNITATKQYLTQTGNGSVSAPPVWGTISAADIPGSALTKTDDTNVTLTLGGSPTTALLNATSLTLGWTGQLGLTRGGMNASLTASNGGIFYSTASAGAILSGTATARQMLQSGASAAPAWSTATWPATTTINQILYSSAANTVTGITAANSSVLVTNGSGVPSESTTLPQGLTIGTGALSGTTAAISFATALSDGNFINFGSTGQNAGLLNDGTLFYSNNLNWDATNNVYKYASNNAGVTIEEGLANIYLKAAPNGTVGNTATPVTAVQVNSNAEVLLPQLTASSVLSLDGSNKITTAALSQNTAAAAAIVPDAIYFGDGSGGALVISNGSTLTLSSDIFPSSITLTNNSKIVTAGWKIFCSGTTSIASGSSISRNGNNASGQTAGAALTNNSLGGSFAGGNGGNALTNGTAGSVGGTSIGGDGGRGADSATNTGAAGGSQTIPNTNYYLPMSFTNAAQGMANNQGVGAGGGGGAGNATIVGGGGGGGGGTLYLATKVLSGAGTVESKGGNGGNTTSTAGVGAGGGGGIVILIYQSFSGGFTSAQVDVSGGAIGTGGATTNATAGGVGRKFLFQI